MKKKMIIPLILLTATLFSCGAPYLEGEITRQEAINKMISLPDTENFKYSKYSFVGEMNFLGDKEKYAFTKDNLDLVKSEKFRVSNYFGIALYLNSLGGVEDNFTKIDRKMAAPDSKIVTRYAESANKDIIFTISGVNKRVVLPIPDLDLEASAKWNIKFVYNVEGMLVSEECETINRGSVSDKESIYLKAVYNYHE